MTKPKLVQPPGVELLLRGSDGKRYSYHFYFYQATWTGDDQCSPRYMAHCNTVGCQEVFGEGLDWDRAMSDCLRKLVDQKII